MIYNKTMGRITIQLSDTKCGDDYIWACSIRCLQGFNSELKPDELQMSIEELHDLRYLIDRAILAAKP